MKLTTSQLKKLIRESLADTTSPALGTYATQGTIGDLYAALDKFRLKVEREAITMDGADPDDAADIALEALQAALDEYMPKT